MTISELITELQKIQLEQWDIKVVVQYRDGGWCYYWYDNELFITIENWKLFF